MKRCVLGIAVCFVLVAAAYAEPPKDNCGCGWGSMAFKGKEGLIYQVLAATTNGSFGNQTFGITSGTAECEKPKSFSSNEDLNKFVADNLDNLAKDIARGEGESLETLAELMGVPEGQRPVFYATLQTHFTQIFPSENITHVDVIENIARVTQS